MNIFYVNEDPVKAAQDLVDSHVVKMILESAQLLSAAHHILDPEKDHAELYRLTHKNHPCAKWVRKSKGNYQWLYDHFIGLLNEYTYRYGKIHKTSRLIDALRDPPQNIPDIGFTSPISAMDEQYLVGNNPISNYKNYYRNGKSHLHKWTKRNKPRWI